jgi:hypothetical protein
MQFPASLRRRSASMGRWEAARRDRCRLVGNIFHLDREGPKLLASHILECVRSERLTPRCTSDHRRSARRSRVEQHLPLWIPADEVARRENIKYASPFVRVERDDRTGLDSPVQHADPIIFVKHRVKPGRRHQSIERIRPRPTALKSSVHSPMIGRDSSAVSAVVSILTCSRDVRTGRIHDHT